MPFNATYECQDADMRAASVKIPRTVVLARRTREYWRSYGFVATVKYVRHFLKRRAFQRFHWDERSRAATLQPSDYLGLAAGEWVEVKSESEIRRGLDRRGRTCGLSFMEGMTAYCGKRLKVYRRAESIILEGSGEMRRLKNTVLLDSAICDGEHYVCDRSCFYFWKETWLRRIPPDEELPKTRFE